MHSEGCALQPLQRILLDHIMTASIRSPVGTVPPWYTINKLVRPSSFETPFKAETQQSRTTSYLGKQKSGLQ